MNIQHSTLNIQPRMGKILVAAFVALVLGWLLWPADAQVTTGPNRGGGGSVGQARGLTNSFGITIDGGGIPITTGVKGYLTIPFACTITNFTALADTTGSLGVDVWKCTYSQFDAGSTHPVAGDRITASLPITINASYKTNSATLTGWNKTVSAGDVIAFNVLSNATITRVHVSVTVVR